MTHYKGIKCKIRLLSSAMMNLTKRGCITKQPSLAGTSGGHTLQGPAKARSATAGCPRPCPAGVLGISKDGGSTALLPCAIRSSAQPPSSWASRCQRSNTHCSPASPSLSSHRGRPSGLLHTTCPL